MTMLIDHRITASEVSVRVEGLKPGEYFQLRFALVSYKKGTTTKTVANYDIQEFVGTTGNTYCKITQIGKRGNGPKGRSERLRVKAWTNSKTAKITKLTTRTLKG